LFFFFIFRFDDDDEETPDASSIHFRFVGGCVLLEMIESAFHLSPLFRVKKNLDFNRDTSSVACDEFPSSREGGVLFHRKEVLPSRDDDDERREMMAPQEKNESTKERSF
jgi:hypothetical protein